MINRFRSALLAATALLAAASPALAVGPGQTQMSVYPQYNTYQAVITALAPAASATDFFTITGSATKQVWVRSIGCTGTTTTVASQQVTLQLRSTADTGGTATNPVAIQTNAGMIGAIGTVPSVAATAVVAAYTANPTVGTAVGPVDGGLLQTPAPASIGAANGLFFSYPLTGADAPLVLTGATQQVALNAGGSSLSSGASLTCKVVWTEH